MASLRLLDYLLFLPSLLLLAIPLCWWRPFCSLSPYRWNHSYCPILAVVGILCTLARITGATGVADVLAFAGVPAFAEPLTLTSTVDLPQCWLHRSKMAKTPGTGEFMHDLFTESGSIPLPTVSQKRQVPTYFL